MTDTTKTPNQILSLGNVEKFEPQGKTAGPMTARPSLVKSPGYAIGINWAKNIEAPKPTDYLIKGIVEPGRVSIWFGPPGNGKTFLMLHLAHAIATGKAVFDRRVRQARTLYMALEGRGGIEKRIYALCRALGDAEAFGYSTTPIDLINGGGINTEHVRALIEAITENNIKLLIIDTMNLTLGGSDENDNSTMGQLIKAAGHIAAETGAHVAFVAHSAKSGIDGGPRGGSAQMGNADMIVAISGDGGTYTASTFAPSGKLKDGAPFKIHFKLNVAELGIDDDGDTMTSCTIEEAETPTQDKSRRLTNTQQGWLTDLANMFCQTGEGAPVEREPHAGFRNLTLTREQVREGYRKKGRIGGESLTDSLTPADRRKLSDNLNKLKDLGKIGMTADLIWLIGPA
jgi:hypothetical protein